MNVKQHNQSCQKSINQLKCLEAAFMMPRVNVILIHVRKKKVCTHLISVI